LLTLSVSFPPKDIKIRSHVSKSYSKPKVGRFLRHGVCDTVKLEQTFNSC